MSVISFENFVKTVFTSEEIERYQSATSQDINNLQKNFKTSEKISKLKVDLSYQRPLNRGHIRKIIKNFSIDAVTDVIISGRNTIINGDHTTAVLYLLGVDCVPVSRRKVVGSQEEASLFKKLNTSYQVSALASFYADLASKEAYAIEIHNMADKYGFTIKDQPCSNALRFPKTIIDCYLLDTNALNVTMYFLSEIQKKNPLIGRVSRQSFMGVFYLVREHGESEILSRINKVATCDFETLAKQSINYIRSKIGGNESFTLYGLGVGKVIDNCYKRHTKVKRLAAGF